MLSANSTPVRSLSSVVTVCAAQATHEEGISVEEKKVNKTHARETSAVEVEGVKEVEMDGLKEVKGVEVMETVVEVVKDGEYWRSVMLQTKGELEALRVKWDTVLETADIPEEGMVVSHLHRHINNPNTLSNHKH